MFVNPATSSLLVFLVIVLIKLYYGKKKKVTIQDYMKVCEMQQLGCTKSIDGTRVSATTMLVWLLEDGGFWQTPKVLSITKRHWDPEGCTPEDKKSSLNTN